MIRHHSIKSKLILYMLIGILIPFSIGMTLVQSNTEAWSYEKSREEASWLLEQTARRVDESFITVMENTVRLVAQEPHVRQANGQLTSYENFQPENFLYSPTETEQRILQFFRTIQEINPVVTMVSMGTEDGGYAEYPPFFPSSSYDPRIRGWYQNGLTASGPVLSAPYQTQLTKNLVISMDHPITWEGKTIGVASLTVSLENLMRELSRVSYGETGELYLMTGDHIFIHSPSHPEWLMKSALDPEIPEFFRNISTGSDSFEAAMDGKELLVTTYTSPYSNWIYVGIIDREEVMAQARQLKNLLFTTLLIPLPLMFLMILLLSNGFTRPLRRITGTINRMAAFDSNLVPEEDLAGILPKKGETGDVARALVAMHQSHIRANENIRYLIDNDALTSLPNRRFFHQKLEETLAAGGRGAVLLLDLDNFKGINDSRGHIFGDRVLQAIADSLKKFLSPDIFLSRFGGDEFLILCSCSDDCEDRLTLLLDQINREFSAPLILDGQPVSVRFSIGIARFPEDSLQMEQLITYADLALYQVKRTSKNHHSYFQPEMAEELHRRIKIREHIERNLDSDGFQVHYQPQIGLISGEVEGYEALARLRNGSLSPCQFIPVAEESGLIQALGRQITYMVVEQLAEWKANDFPLLPISINFSSAQLQDESYADFLLDQLRLHQVPPRCIIMEITESIFLENRRQTLEFLEGLRREGIRIAVDDFGTGYSSLSYLTFLPLDILKLDSVLCHRFLEMDNPEAMGSLIKLAQSLHLRVIAEGIEEEAQVQKLKAAGCDAIQGFYFAKPLPPAEATKKIGVKFLIP